jgi:hypothetical protein
VSRDPTGFAVLTARTTNLGDDIQALAALSHLPVAHHVIDRDDIAGSELPPGTPVVLNGWWTNYPERLSASACTLDPLLTSIHLARTGVLSANGTTVLQALERPEVLAFLRAHGPVGCRDQATVDVLSERGVAAYFSGCLTLTLERSGVSSPAARALLVVDLPRSLAGQVRRSTSLPVEVGTNWISPRSLARERMLAARHRLMQIERAEAVVTTRLHVALPSLALGVPVLWVVSAGADGRVDSYRSWVPHTTAEGLAEALRDRATGWPANPSCHRSHAIELTRSVQAWVNGHSSVFGSPTRESDVPPPLSYAHLTAETQRDWEQLDRAARARIRASRWAVADRLRHRRMLVSDGERQET